MHIARIIFTAVILTSAACRSAAGSVDRLSCKFGVVFIDAAEYVHLRKAVLSHDYFTAWVELDIERGVSRRYPHLTLKDEWGMAYQLDDSSVTGIHPLVRTRSIMTALTFPHLKAGGHVLRLGLLDRTGQLTDDNAYCFSSPGKFVLTTPNSH